jgi:hypothetical protein
MGLFATHLIAIFISRLGSVPSTLYFYSNNQIREGGRRPPSLYESCLIFMENSVFRSFLFYQFFTLCLGWIWRFLLLLHSLFSTYLVSGPDFYVRLCSDDPSSLRQHNALGLARDSSGKNLVLF